jgi:hypothetical protein
LVLVPVISEMLLRWDSHGRLINVYHRRRWHVRRTTMGRSSGDLAVPLIVGIILCRSRFWLLVLVCTMCVVVWANACAVIAFKAV